MRAAIWPISATAAAALLWLAVARSAEEGAVMARQDGLGRVQTFSQAYEQYLTRSFAHLDQISMQLKMTLETSPGQFDVGRLGRGGMFHDDLFACVAFAEVDGPIRSAVRASGCFDMLHQAAVMAHHAGNNSSAMRISAPADPVHAQHFLLISRRVERGDSQFAGVVLMVVRTRYFTDFFLPSSAGRVATVLAVGTDAAWQAGPATRGQPAPMPPGADSGAGVVDAGTGAARLTGWTRSRAYPLAAVVALPLDAVMAPARAAAAQARTQAWLGTCALALLALLATVLSRRAADRYSAQENVRKAYRTATEGANDGFYMAAPVRDRHGAIIDFEIVDCNTRGAGFYGLARQAMVGKRLSMLAQLVAGEEDVMAAYRNAMEHGFHEDERRMPQHEQVTITWGQRRIVRVGSGLAITLRDVSERRQHLEQLDRLSNEDALTGLPNRQWLMGSLPGALTAAAGEVALLFIDLADFRHVNDTHGHQVGDQLLQACAQRLQQLLRPEDRVVRFGGNEFVVMLAPAEGDLHSERVAERIVSAFAAPFSLGPIRVLTGASIGISVYPRDGSDGHDLIRHADIAMEASKADGERRVRFYDPSLSRSLQGRLRLKQGLLDALEQDQFTLYYQPRVDLATGRLCSMEALIRWIHPEHGMIAPLDFIPLAEATGLIMPLGELVMDKASAQLAAWRAAGLPLVPVSINVSPRQFAHGALPAQLAARLARHALPADLLEVEVTESAMMGDQDDIVVQLDVLRALGIKLHVDDFGTGYSSLSQLQRLRMDVLKVDRAFTTQLDQSREGRVFFQAIVSMAHALGMAVVAEGVETAQQLAILRELGCNEVQGYYLGKPVPAAAMAQLLASPLLLIPAPARAASPLVLTAP